MDAQSMLKVLSLIGAELDRGRITWAVSGSLALYLRSKAPLFHDIDLLVAEADAERAKAALLRLGELQPPNPSPQYRTRHFWEFIVQGVEVDVMAGFAIVKGGREYYFPLEAGAVLERVPVNGAAVPLQPLPELRIWYELMDRAEKVRMIDGALDAGRTGEPSC